MRRSLLCSLVAHGFVLGGLAWVVVEGMPGERPLDGAGWVFAPADDPVETPVELRSLEDEMEPATEALRTPEPTGFDAESSLEPADPTVALGFGRIDPFAGAAGRPLASLRPRAAPEPPPERGPGTQSANPIDRTPPGPAPAAGPDPMPRRPVLVPARPRLRGNRPPAYPVRAVRRGWQGEVLLAVSLSAEGRVDGVDVLRGSGRELLDRAAVEAVRAWRFEPATRDGRPVASVVEVPVAFRLE